MSNHIKVQGRKKWKKQLDFSFLKKLKRQTILFRPAFVYM